MKRKLGSFLMILGCAFLVAALVLFLHNRQEQQRAAAASQEAITKVVDVILKEKEEIAPAEATEPLLPEDRVMKVTQIDGYDYIGFLNLPALELELPVMAEWTYPQLQIAPCRYTGSIFTDDLVIMAHNYPKHFGGLKDMKTGEQVTFTDMDGNSILYQVAALEILPPDAVEDVTSGDFALTLFTCTYGGENRVVLRCDRVQNGR